MKLTLSPADEAEMAPLVVDVDDNPRIEPEVLIGRAHDCDLRIRKKYVSRHHCGISFDTKSHSVRVRDLGSCNGTFVNNSRVTGFCDVHDGDTLLVGYVPFKVGISGQSSSVWDRIAARQQALESTLPRQILLLPHAGDRPICLPNAT